MIKITKFLLGPGISNGRVNPQITRVIDNQGYFWVIFSFGSKISYFFVKNTFWQVLITKFWGLTRRVNPGYLGLTRGYYEKKFAQIFLKLVQN